MTDPGRPPCDAPILLVCGGRLYLEGAERSRSEAIPPGDDPADLMATAAADFARRLREHLRSDPGAAR